MSSFWAEMVTGVLNTTHMLFLLWPAAIDFSVSYAYDSQQNFNLWPLACHIVNVWPMPHCVLLCCALAWEWGSFSTRCQNKIWKCFAALDISHSGLYFIHTFFLSAHQVGFFPSECVELINDKVPQSMTNTVPKPGKSPPVLHPAVEHALEGSDLTTWLQLQTVAITAVKDITLQCVLHTGQHV